MMPSGTGFPDVTSHCGAIVRIETARGGGGVSIAAGQSLLLPAGLNTKTHIRKSYESLCCAHISAIPSSAATIFYEVGTAPSAPWVENCCAIAEY